MKSTESFKKVISDHLASVAAADPVFTEKMANPKKSIDNCITYILNQVKESGCNGFADAEIFGMAIHYYDEENIQPGAKVSCNVVVNHKPELTPEEIENAKKEAREQIVAGEIERLRKKPAKKKEEPQRVEQTSLF
jgi:hypothetical protein